MKCIYCGYKLRISNSRLQKKTNQTWRRRKCLECNAIFTTLEAIDYSKSLVVRETDNSLAPFSREKLFLSIYRSCRHRLNPLEDAAALTDTTVSKITKQSNNGVVSLSNIKDSCVNTLRQFDKAAVVQYKAYHS
jgi:transcriptional repressor NrdR